jgi:hypothetical protein
MVEIQLCSCIIRRLCHVMDTDLTSLSCFRGGLSGFILNMNLPANPKDIFHTTALTKPFATEAEETQDEAEPAEVDSAGSFSAGSASSCVSSASVANGFVSAVVWKMSLIEAVLPSTGR